MLNGWPLQVSCCLRLVGGTRTVAPWEELLEYSMYYAAPLPGPTLRSHDADALPGLTPAPARRPSTRAGRVAGRVCQGVRRDRVPVACREQLPNALRAPGSAFCDAH